MQQSNSVGVEGLIRTLVWCREGSCCYSEALVGQICSSSEVWFPAGRSNEGRRRRMPTSLTSSFFFFFEAMLSCLYQTEFEVSWWGKEMSKSPWVLALAAKIVNRLFVLWRFYDNSWLVERLVTCAMFVIADRHSWCTCLCLNQSWLQSLVCHGLKLNLWMRLKVFEIVCLWGIRGVGVVCVCQLEVWCKKKKVICTAFTECSPFEFFHFYF